MCLLITQLVLCLHVYKYRSCCYSTCYSVCLQLQTQTLWCYVAWVSMHYAVTQMISTLLQLLNWICIVGQPKLMLLTTPQRHQHISALILKWIILRCSNYHMNATHCGASLHELLYLLHQEHRCEHVARCQLHYCMQCIVLAAKDLDKSHPIQCTVNLH